MTGWPGIAEGIKARSRNSCKPLSPFIRLIPLTGGASTPGTFRAVVIMSFLSKLFSKKAEPKQRIRVCVECGMPIAEHKQWCSILRGQQEMERKARGQAAATNQT
jgi:hypothetical protein